MWGVSHEELVELERHENVVETTSGLERTRNPMWIRVARALISHASCEGEEVCDLQIIGSVLLRFVLRSGLDHHR